MDRNARQRLIRRGLATAAGAVVVVVFAASWYFSNVLRDDLLVPTPFTPESTSVVTAVGTGRIILEPGPDAERDGVYGLLGPNGYGQVSNVLAITDTGVERGFRLFEGTIEVGDPVALDQYAYAGDPETAHGIDFREIRFSGDLGQHPAWVIDGDRDTWVIVVHGKGLEERRQA
ncbi:MAG: hypothetical protein KJP12_06775, partial [Acidimicrobiia bacterium]|nr:hypothetical protein [Acidimicrobiia bacterium]